jgi:hypothetical protein
MHVSGENPISMHIGMSGKKLQTGLLFDQSDIYDINIRILGLIG